MPNKASHSCTVRTANELDIPGIQKMFHDSYGDDYPYHGFYEAAWIKHALYNDNIAMFVAEDPATHELLGSASLDFSVGAFTDLLAEFGRLVVTPEARCRGVGHALMKKRVEYVEDKIHIGIVENRVVHPYSQMISHAHGFTPVGFLPLKHLFHARESLSLFVRYFQDALNYRKPVPRVIPEVQQLAQLALASLGIDNDLEVMSGAQPYTHRVQFDLEELKNSVLPALLHIERGRLSHREVFGPARLHYGFFRLHARHAQYFIARDQAPKGEIAGAIGFIRDKLEKSLRIFELITPNDDAIYFLLKSLLDKCQQQWGLEYIEVDVSAYAPRLQQTLIELGFVPAAYLPAMAFHQIERVDVIKMCRLLVPLDVGGIQLAKDNQRQIADLVIQSIHEKIR